MAVAGAQTTSHLVTFLTILRRLVDVDVVPTPGLVVMFATLKVFAHTALAGEGLALGLSLEAAVVQDLLEDAGVAEQLEDWLDQQQHG